MTWGALWNGLRGGDDPRTGFLGPGPNRRPTAAGAGGGALMKDRRRDVRILEENKVAVFPLTGEVRPGERTVYHSLTRDISMGGVRLMTVAPLEAGMRVRLEITLGRSRKRIRAVAEVRWVRELYGREVFEAGLQFTGLDPDAEFALMDHIFGGRNGRGS